MSLQNLQEQVNEWTSQFKPQYWNAHEILARLIEETGELAREINHLYGPKPKKPSEEKKELGNEIADVFFTLICLANSKNINLDEAWNSIMKKYTERDANRYEKA